MGAGMKYRNLKDSNCIMRFDRSRSFDFELFYCNNKKINLLNYLLTYLLFKYKVKSKVPPYSTPNVGPRADPGLQAVRPQVIFCHPPAVDCHYLP